MRSKRREEDTPSVMMEPMIDIVFLLLIFFLVVATIRKKHLELPIELPPATTSVEKKAVDETIVISIFPAEGGVQYALATVGEQARSSGGAREMVGLDQLRTRLRDMAVEMPGRPVRIDADVSVPYGRIAQVIDHLQVYGLQAVGLKVRR